MAHRKHLSQEGHAEPHKVHKKTAADHSKKAEHHKNAYNKEHREYTRKEANKSNYANSHIKDEHGEY